TDRVLFPVMSRGQQNREGLTKGYLDSLALVNTLTLPASVALSLLSPEFVRIVLGPGWDGAATPLRWLALALALRMTSKINKSLARAHGAVYATATRQ